MCQNYLMKFSKLLLVKVETELKIKGLYPK